MYRRDYFLEVFGLQTIIHYTSDLIDNLFIKGLKFGCQQ